MIPRIRTHRDCPHCGHRVPWHHVRYDARRHRWECLTCRRRRR